VLLRASGAARFLLCDDRLLVLSFGFLALLATKPFRRRTERHHPRSGGGLNPNDEPRTVAILSNRVLVS